MEISPVLIGPDGGGSGSFDLGSFGSGAFDVSSFGSTSFDATNLSGAGFDSLGSSFDFAGSGLSDFGGSSLDVLLGAANDFSSPVAQGDALRMLDDTTGSRGATDNLVSGGSPVGDADMQGPEIVVTADRRLTELVSRDNMSDAAFAQFERDDAGLRMERDAQFERTGQNYSILPAERELAAQYNLMGNFVGLTSLAPNNYYAGQRPEPGSLADIGGKIAASPMTIVGAVAGTANVLAGVVAGNDVAIKIDDNAVQFVGGAFGQGGNAIGYGGAGAVTIGNTQLYAGDVTPDTPTRGYDNQGPEFRTGDHEEGHTYQYQDRGLGFLPEYLPNGLQNAGNPFEQAADTGARGGNPIP